MNIAIKPDEFTHCPYCGKETILPNTQTPDLEEFYTIVCVTCLLAWEVPGEEVPKEW